MLPIQYDIVLKKLVKTLDETDVIWALTASTSLIIQGLDVKPNDIDIATTKDGAYIIDDYFQEHSIKKVSYSTDGNIRSHFGCLNIGGIDIDIIGDIQYKINGIWSETREITKLIEHISYNGIYIPVLNLKSEYEGYQKMGRLKMVAQIKALC